MSMFCYQCEQTSKGTGCTVAGVCGKDQEVAGLQDLLLWAAKGISMYAHRARQYGAKDRKIDRFVMEAMFTTVTNVNFDPVRLQNLLVQAGEVMDRAKSMYETAARNAGQEPERLDGPAAWRPSATVEQSAKQAEAIALTERLTAYGPDLAGLQELMTYGLKGTAAYADHAMILGQEDDSIYAGFHEGLDYLAKDNPTVEELVSRCLKVGELNLRVMELLDQANTSTYGDPVPTKVRITPVQGKAILISGHDLKDLEELLKQTEGKGINVYTHGEMLPAHGYPKLKAYKHLVGNYGGAWQDQQKEFEQFPGAILMTTNCIQKPRQSYTKRIFTTGLVAWPGLEHLTRDDFGQVVRAALEAPGFAETAPEKTILVGFGHAAVMGVSDKVIEAVKSGQIKHFFLIGGCDGAKSGRNYYTEFAQSVPQDSVILTLACGKYRFNKLEFGEVAGMPRLLDVGQCNDAYSAIQIAVALSNAFGVGVNELPLSLVLSWYEQKAVAILLTLLSLGIKDIYLGPTLPVFVGPNVAEVLVNDFGIKPITTARKDLTAILAK
jgi:hydroxylamine reductase